MITNMIRVRTDFEGLHCYPNAPDEVSFLRQLHRHKFEVVLDIEVFHLDRELEFLMVKNRLNQFINDNIIKADKHCSCEMYASMIINFVIGLYGPDRNISCEVNEDGENGAFVVYNVVRKAHSFRCGMDSR